MNVINGYGPVAGKTISEYTDITTSTPVSGLLMNETLLKAAAENNSKAVTFELGRKSPNIVFGDVDLD